MTPLRPVRMPLMTPQARANLDALTAVAEQLGTALAAAVCWPSGLKIAEPLPGPGQADDRG